MIGDITVHMFWTLILSHAVHPSKNDVIARTISIVLFAFLIHLRKPLRKGLSISSSVSEQPKGELLTSC